MRVDGELGLFARFTIRAGFFALFSVLVPHEIPFTPQETKDFQRKHRF
jgi:hypothetical protein